MPSTIGHSICGMACFAVARRLNPHIARYPTGKGMLFFALLANLPDLDLLAGYLFASNPLQYHWGLTHTLWFGLLAGALTGGVLKVTGHFSVFAWSLLALVAGSHIVLDLVTGPQWGIHPSYGLRLWAPLWDVKVSSPVSLFLGVKHESGYLLGLHNLLSVAIEILIFSPVVIALAVTSENREWLRKHIAQTRK